MKRFVGLSLAAGALFTCLAATSGQAAPVSGAVAELAPAARHLEPSVRSIGDIITIAVTGGMVVAAVVGNRVQSTYRNWCSSEGTAPFGTGPIEVNTV